MRFYYSLISTLAFSISLAPVAYADSSELSTTALFQTWATVYDADADAQADSAGYGDIEADAGFSIRRARFGLVDTAGPLRFSLELGTSSPYDGWFDNDSHQSIGLVDANLSRVYGNKDAGVVLTVGAMKTPFSREALISAKDLSFQERGVATAHMAPGRDVGALFDYRHASGLRVRTGVFNGNNDITGDNNTGVSSVSRIEYSRNDSYSITGAGRAFGLGVSTVYESDLATTRMGAGLDMLMRAHNFGVLLEAVALNIAPSDTTITSPSVLTPTKRLGLTGQLAYFIPTKTGGLEISSRYSQYDDAVGLSDNGDVGIIHSGLALHNNDHGIKVGVGMINRLELGGTTATNDTVRLWLQYVPRAP